MRSVKDHVELGFNEVPKLTPSVLVGQFTREYPPELSSMHSLGTRERCSREEDK